MIQNVSPGRNPTFALLLAGLFLAGCLIKPLSAVSLGNTRDGDLDTYPVTLRTVRAAYPDAKVVVPVHGDWGGLDLIDHTLHLCQSNNR
jgi:metallo-beta-lactamase class B